MVIIDTPINVMSDSQTYFYILIINNQIALLNMYNVLKLFYNNYQ